MIILFRSTDCKISYFESHEGASVVCASIGLLVTVDYDITA